MDTKTVTIALERHEVLIKAEGSLDFKRLSKTTLSL